MLNTMRKNLKALSWVLWLVVASFVIAIFVEWGRAGDAARAGANANWMARVNGEPISISQFQETYFTLERVYRQLYGNQYNARNLGIARQALNQLVRERLILDEARRLGLRATPGEISDRITRDPSFQTDGRFIGVDAYRDLLAANGIDPVTFERSVAGDVVAEKYRRLVTDSVSVSPDEVREDYRRRNERVTADYILLEPDAFPAPEPPTEEALREYYEARRMDYNSPEQRRASYVLINPDELPGLEPVTEDEIRQYYDENVERLYSTPEQVRASHILFRLDAGASEDEVAKARASAEDVLRRVQAGEDFATLAETYSDDGSATLGGDLGFFGRGRMVPEFEREAFSLPVGGTSGIVRTEFGFHIIRVTDRREAVTQPLAKVHDSIRQDLEFARTQERLAETVRTFREAVAADPGAFDRTAAELGLAVEDTGLVTREATVAAIGDAPQVARAVFQVDIGEVSPPVTVPQGTLFLRTVEVLPPQPLSFDEAREQVESNYEATEALARARARVVEAMQPGIDLATLAKALGATVATTSSFSRLQAPDPFGPAARDLAFSLDVHQVSEPVEVQHGLLVFQVNEREGFDPVAFEDMRENLARSMLQQRRDRLFSAVLSGLESASQIQINHARMDVVEGRDA